MTPLRVAMIVFLAASIQAQPLDVPPSAAQLREWIDDGCVRSGKHVGIDYSGALERAIRREPAGLAELFRYTVIGELDGAAGEAHAAILLGLLPRWSQHLRQKSAPVEWREVVDLLAGADESSWDFQFILNCDHDSAFAAAVEFGHDQTGELERVMKFAGLTERIAASGCIDNEKNFVRRTRIVL